MKISNTQERITLQHKKHTGMKQPQTFKGGVSGVMFNALDKGFSVLDKNAMIQVAFVDSVFTDIPRTLVDLKTSLASALETGRREFSGLIINCLMPGFIVKGAAKVLPKAENLKGTDVVGSWANGDTINKLKGVYEQAQNSDVSDKTREFVSKTLTSIEGLDGKNWVKYSDYANNPEFQDAIGKVTTAVSKKGKARTTLLKQAQGQISKLTKAESILKFNGAAHSNLEETLRDVADLGSKFNKVKDRTIKNLGATAETALNGDVSTKVTESVNNYSKSLTKLVNQKSIAGLITVIAIAVSMQSINRAITRKQFKAEGAPIYKDFGKKDTTQKMDEKQKKKFFAKKVASAAGMYGMAAASMMKKPSMGMFQFSGIFPTMDQCRWIASSTFASRMLAAEDENELRESTVRDIVSFAGLYFLGDYVKKSVASAFEALSKTKSGAKLIGENVVLLNRKKEIAKPILENGASFSQKAASQIAFRAKQLGNWVKNTELKTAAEVSCTNVRNLRNICRVADIAFSGLILGVLLPKYNRAVTERKVAEAQKQQELQKKTSVETYNMMQKNNMASVFKDMVPNTKQ